MQKRAISADALKRVKHIHSLSRAYNKKVRFPHNKRLFELMRHHIVEIEQLFIKKDKHFLIETGDLMVLCCELLLENKVSIDDTFLRCFERYERKLTQLIKETERQGK